MDDEWDFGFSAVSEDELETVEMSKKIAEEHEQSMKDVHGRLKMLYDNIIPLLDNLRKNPEKEYIYWPDRTQKIDAFEEKLSRIVDGDIE